MDEEILVNPYTAIRLFARTYLAFGEEVLKDRKFKVTREAWIAAMYLLGRSKSDNKDWWLAPVTDKSGSPDFYCYSFVRNKSDEHTVRERIKLEVFEWRKEEKVDNLLEALKRIKLDKIIDPEITIVCYIRRDFAVPPAVELKNQIEKFSVKVKDVWYLGNIDPEGKMWRVTQLYPNNMAVDLNYDEILATKESYSFLHAYRGKSDNVIYEHTGSQVLLTPEFKIQKI